MDAIETLPLVPLRDVVIFPHMMIPFVIGRPSSVKALEHALVKGGRIFLSAQRDASSESPVPEEIYTLGTICNIVQSLKLSDGNVKVLMEGLDRGRALEFKDDGRFLEVVVKAIPRFGETESGIEALRPKVVSLFERYVKLSNKLHYDAMLAAVHVEDPGKLADTISSHLAIAVEEKQHLLETFSAQERLTRIAAVLEAEIDRLEKEPRVEAQPEGPVERTLKDRQLRDLEQQVRDVEARLRAAERTITPLLWSVVALAVLVVILALLLKSHG